MQPALFLLAMGSKRGDAMCAALPVLKAQAVRLLPFAVRLGS